MIFKETWQQVLDGTKRQTRRPVKPEEWSANEYGRVIPDHVWGNVIDAVRSSGNLKWQAGRDYAVQPGRGKKAVGRIRITKIRRERVQQITWQDAVAEGIPQYARLGMPDSQEIYCQFWNLWDSVYPTGPYAWEKNPEVWVLEFEVVKEERCPKRS